MNDSDKTLEQLEILNEIKTTQLKEQTTEVISDRNLSAIANTISFWRFGITIPEYDTQIVVNVSGPIMFGRANLDDGTYTYIDLSPYDAVNCGVSRSHAFITIHKNNIVIQDFNSSNGTFLNEKKLKTMTKYPLNEGDTIRFAKLNLQFNVLYNPFSS